MNIEKRQVPVGFPEKLVMRRVSRTFYGAIMLGLLAAVSNVHMAVVNFSLANEVITTVTTAVPSIAQLASQSEFPDVTRFVFTMAWLAQPLLLAVFVYWFANSELGGRTLEKYRKYPVLLTFGVYLGIPALVAASWSLMGNKPIPETGGTFGVQIERGMTHSRWFLGIASGTIAVANPLLVALAINWTRNLRKIFAH